MCIMAIPAQGRAGIKKRREDVPRRSKFKTNANGKWLKLDAFFLQQRSRIYQVLFEGCLALG